ncbi:Thioredoxin domain-containing protein [Desulforamulus ruminis DSM 2154]|uniref:Thioredoxin domain-containing protein n=2 Tax=Desulforamulus ruminis TaxID=1564 RepID=F6DQX9_DESRL|nr:Thioredoxin domain-containing protein [Desulforamulus ruminis DSM 2154]
MTIISYTGYKHDVFYIILCNFYNLHSEDNNIRNAAANLIKAREAGGESMGYETFQRLTIENFDACTFDSDTPSLVFFAAERCNICKELLPIMEDFVEYYAGRLNIYYVDVDKYAELHRRFQLRGIPQLLIFKENEFKDRIGGLHEKEEIMETIDSIINKN